MSKKTVILNCSCEPLRRVSWQKAVTLVFLDKVEIISSHDEVIHSPSMQMQIPSIVRLKKQVQWRWEATKFSRSNIFKRDKYRCQYCGDKLNCGELTFDHVIPKCQGGKTEWTNIVTACKPCNQNKGDKTPQQANMILLNIPNQPKIPLAQLFDDILRE